jgi:hypothetical protein
LPINPNPLLLGGSSNTKLATLCRLILPFTPTPIVEAETTDAVSSPSVPPFRPFISGTGFLFTLRGEAGVGTVPLVDPPGDAPPIAVE